MPLRLLFDDVFTITLPYYYLLLTTYYLTDHESKFYSFTPLLILIRPLLADPGSTSATTNDDTAQTDKEYDELQITVISILYLICQ